MQLIRLEAKNFCRHRQLNLQFHPGMTAIVGPNGAGKSTVLASIGYALVGDSPWLPGTKADNINQLAPAAEPSGVLLEFVHGNARCVIERWLRPTGRKSRLTVNGAEPLLGDTNVNARLRDILGVTGEILCKYLLVGQGEMFAPLSASTAERSKIFQRLFGTDAAGDLWKRIGDFTSKVTAPSIPDVMALQAAAQATEQRLAEVQAEIAAYTAREPSQTVQQQAVWQQTIEQYQIQQRAATAAQNFSELLAKNDADLAYMRTELQSLTDDAATIQAAIDKGQETAKQAQAALTNWTAYQARQAAADRTRKRCQELENELMIPEPSPNYPTELAIQDARQQWKQRVMEMTTELAAAKTRLQKFADSGVVACPTCGTPRTNLIQVLEADKRTVAELPAKIAVLQDGLAAFTAYSEARAAWIQRQRSLEQQIASLRAAMPDTSPVETVDESQTRQLLATHAQFVAGAQEIREEIAKLTTRQGMVARLRDTTQRQYDAAMAELATPITPEQYQAAKEAQEQAVAVVAVLRRAAQERDQLERTLAYNRQQIAQAMQQLQTAARTKTFLEHMAAVRNVLHHDCLPKIASQRYLVLLQDSINDILNRFEADFRVTAAEGLTFTVKFKDGREHGTGRLSGGQKIVLAWALRIATNSRFARDLGLIGLDEPTEALDADNIRCVHRALDRLRELSTSCGLQCIVVTHERSLERFFDRVEWLNG